MKKRQEEVVPDAARGVLRRPAHQGGPPPAGRDGRGHRCRRRAHSRPPPSRLVIRAFSRGDDQDDEEQRPGHRGGVAEVEVLPADLVDQLGDGLELTVGAAGGRGRVLSKSIGSVKSCRPPMVDSTTVKITTGWIIGTVMPPELTPRPGAVDGGRLVDVLRDGLHGRQVEQRVVADPLPVDHRGDRDPRGSTWRRASRSARCRRCRAAPSTQLAMPVSRAKNTAKTSVDAATGVMYGSSTPTRHQVWCRAACGSAGWPHQRQQSCGIVESMKIPNVL